MANKSYIEIRLDKQTGDIITVIDDKGNKAKPKKKKQMMPLKKLGKVQSLDVAVIYHASPGCICLRGRCWCW